MALRLTRVARWTAIVLLAGMGARAVLAQATAVSATGSTLIRAGRLLDVVNGGYRPTAAVLVTNGRIVQTGTFSELQPRAPAGTKVITLPGVTLLPGLIDAHAHVLATMDGRMDPSSNILAAITEVGLAGRIRLGMTNARDLLLAGFTTVRNLGHSGIDGDIALRAAIDAGSIPGPRILAAGRKITPPGGQSVKIQTGDAEAILREEYIPIHNVTEAERAVSDLVAIGVDVVKIVADDDTRILTRDEIAAIVAAAHRAHLRVAAHATTAPGIQAAIDGGVDTVEHGNDATDAMLTAMRDKGIALVATAYTLETLRDIYLWDSVMSDEERAAAEKQMTSFIDSYATLVRRAVKAGVKVVAGSDMWMLYPGKTRGQATKTMLRALVRTGMPPASVIRATTADAADVIGWSDRVGSLTPGRYADIIGVLGDPLRDISALDNVAFVMKGGTVFVPPPR